MPRALVEAKERVGKQIAHLTKRRFEDGAPVKTWHPDVEVPALTKPLKLFASHTDPNKFQSTLKSRIEFLPDLWLRGV